MKKIALIGRASPWRRGECPPRLPPPLSAFSIRRGRPCGWRSWREDRPRRRRRRGSDAADAGDRTPQTPGPLEHTFALRNDAGVPLTLDRLQSSCSCTTPAFIGAMEGATVAPGGRFPCGSP